ncbi:MAG TPA: efflux RND transporter periplasmic adaptor subunit [Thermoanaerobaculia bacterium]|nr:efflux RND transporter periplasmic adaptor subunit [Thermoanaerobaculia bacterium]
MRSRTTSLAPAAAALLLAASALLAGCGNSDASSGPPGGRPGGPPVPVVEGAEVVRGPYEVREDFVGTLEARAAAEVSARAAGSVVALGADIGDPVRRGQILARLESSEQREAVNQAQADLQAAQATLAQRRSALDIAATTSRRIDSLQRQDLVSEQQRDAAAAELAGARAQVDVAAAQVAQAQARLSSARVELEQTLVVAPFDGVVARRYLDAGDYAAPNTPLFQIADLSVIRIQIPLPSAQAARVEPGRPATVRVRNAPGVEFRGEVTRISDVFDPRSGTTQAQVELANPDGRLKPGLLADVTVLLGRGDDAALVPRPALVESEGRWWVFRVAEGPQGQAVADRLPVEVVGRALAGDDGRVAVRADLEAGQLVLTLGHETLTDGAPVTVAAADAAPPGTGAGGSGEPAR